MKLLKCSINISTFAISGVLLACSGSPDNNLAESGQLPQGESPKSEIEVVDGQVIYQGDMVLGSVEDFDGAELEELDHLTKLQSSGAFDLSKRYQGSGVNGVFFGSPWPQGVVTYYFDTAVGGTVPANQQTAFRNAVAHYEQWTTLQFVEDTAAPYPTNVIKVTTATAGKCDSKVGMQTSAQTINVAGCGTTVGPFIHEIGHAIGLIHEQSRPDRDSFVTVGSTTDAANCGKETNAATTSHYDYGSIMHYPANTTQCGAITSIVPGVVVNPSTNALSPYDIQGIQVMYGTEFDKAVTSARRGTTNVDILHHGDNNGFAWAKTKQSGSFIGSWLSLGGPNNTNIVGHPEETSWSNTRRDVFVRGRDNALYRKSWNGSWSPSETGWTAVSGAPTMRSSPSAVSWGSGRLDVFYKRSDHAVAHVFSSNAANTTPTWTVANIGTPGGGILGRPRVVSWGSGRLDIIAVGRDQKIYHKALVNSTWSPSATGWNDLGGNVVGTPTIVSWGANRLDMFARQNDGRLIHKAWAGAWSPSQSTWEVLDAGMNSNPEATTWGSNRLDIVYQGTGGEVRWKRWTSAGWQTPVNLGGAIIGTPTITTRGSNQLDVFVRGTDNALWNIATTDGSTWSAWASQGGVQSW